MTVNANDVSKYSFNTVKQISNVTVCIKNLVDKGNITKELLELKISFLYLVVHLSESVISQIDSLKISEDYLSNTSGDMKDQIDAFLKMFTDLKNETNITIIEHEKIHNDFGTTKESSSNLKKVKSTKQLLRSLGIR